MGGSLVPDCEQAKNDGPVRASQQVVQEPQTYNLDWQAPGVLHPNEPTVVYTRVIQLNLD